MNKITTLHVDQKVHIVSLFKHRRFMWHVSIRLSRLQTRLSRKDSGCMILTNKTYTYFDLISP